MNFLEKSDDEIIAIANPIWDNLVKNFKYEKIMVVFTKDFWHSNVVLGLMK